MDTKSMLIQTELSFVEVKGKKLRVQHINHKNGKDKATIVFLHEGLGCIEMWKGFPEKLCALTGMNGIVYERQGYGGSDHLDLPRPKDYLEREALIWLPELMKILKIENPILLGHSDGASIALIYAGAYPCTAVISEAAHIFVEDITIKGIEEVKADPNLPIIKEKLKKYHAEKTEDIVSAWADTWLSADFRDWNITDKLKGINCHVLLIQGEDDEYASPLHVQKIMEAMPDAASIESIIPKNCAHIPHLQAQNEVLNAMLDFLKKLNLIN